MAFFIHIRGVGAAPVAENALASACDDDHSMAQTSQRGMWDAGGRWSFFMGHHATFITQTAEVRPSPKRTVEKSKGPEKGERKKRKEGK